MLTTNVKETEEIYSGCGTVRNFWPAGCRMSEAGNTVCFSIGDGSGRDFKTAVQKVTTRIPLSEEENMDMIRRFHTIKDTYQQPTLTNMPTIKRNN